MFFEYALDIVMTTSNPVKSNRSNAMGMSGSKRREYRSTSGKRWRNEVRTVHLRTSAGSREGSNTEV